MSDPTRASHDSVAAEEEARLWRELSGGSDTARETLFRLHAPFARRMAVRHRRSLYGGDIELEDLTQLAYAGLIEALGRFDPARGAPFRAFAARRITGNMIDGLAHMSELREQLAFRRRVRRERADSLAADPARDRSVAEDLDQLADLAAGLAIGFLLDGGLLVAEDTADERPNAYQGLAWRQTMRRVVDEVRRLPTRERAVVERHYGDGLDFARIGALLGVSKGRVSQIHKLAIQHLREAIVSLEAVY